MTAEQRADVVKEVLSKAPQATLMFWIVKICATTVGETGGDALSMPPLHLGYATATLIFLGFFAVTLATQVRARRYHPLIYWLVVVATTTVGTTTSDYFDRTLKMGYTNSSAILFGLVVLVLVVWRLTTGKIASDKITSRTDEVFYWLTIVVSNPLGTALGDFTSELIPDLMTKLLHAADGSWDAWGFELGAVLFAGLLAIVALLHFAKALPQAILFWAAYVLTRPLGATLGDTLTKKPVQGGLNLDRFVATGVIAAVMVVLVLLTPRLRKPAEAGQGH
jgi:uncharacterized membrane-anchored protein